MIATVFSLPDPIIWYATAPRLDSAWLVNISVVTPSVEVIYSNQLAIERFLRNTGKRVLERVVSLANNVSQEQHWPLSSIEIKLINDSEVTDWQYVLVIFNFNCDFMTADGYLHDFYKKLDSITDLEEEEDDILQRMVFYDVGTTI
jgi:predicted nucleic acid-binding protein